MDFISGQISTTYEQIEKVQSVNSVMVQNEEPLLVRYLNEPTFVDLMTAIGTIGAVCLSLFLLWRDRRASLCKVKNVNLIYEKSDKFSEYWKHSVSLNVFNKCTFAELKVYKVRFIFFHNLQEFILENNIDEVVPIYSEKVINLTFNSQNGFQQFGTVLAQAGLKAMELDKKLKLLRKPKIIIDTNFGVFKGSFSKESIKNLRKEYLHFKKNYLEQLPM